MSLTPDEQKAYECLAETGYVIDPKYAGKRAEDKLKADCRRCWKYRQWFPKYIRDYIESWKADASTAAQMGTAQRGADQELELASIPGIPVGEVE